MEQVLQVWVDKNTTAVGVRCGRCNQWLKAGLIGDASCEQGSQSKVAAHKPRSNDHRRLRTKSHARKRDKQEEEEEEEGQDDSL